MKRGDYLIPITDDAGARAGVAGGDLLVVGVYVDKGAWICDRNGNTARLSRDDLDYYYASRASGVWSGGDRKICLQRRPGVSDSPFLFIEEILSERERIRRHRRNVRRKKMKKAAEATKQWNRQTDFVRQLHRNLATMDRDVENALRSRNHPGKGGDPWPE